MKTINQLIENYLEFKNNLTGEVKDHLATLASGQSPKILFITCSDSRVSPQLMLNANPGELFIFRNAGNIVSTTAGSSELGTIQYAVDVLGVEDIVVCGHSDCGAVKALLDPDSTNGVPLIKDFLSCCSDDCNLNSEDSVESNVKVHATSQLNKLKEMDIVKAKVEKGTLNVHAWYLDVGEYMVEAYDEVNKSWQELPL